MNGESGRGIVSVASRGPCGTQTRCRPRRAAAAAGFGVWVWVWVWGVVWEGGVRVCSGSWRSSGRSWSGARRRCGRWVRATGVSETLGPAPRVLCGSRSILRNAAPRLRLSRPEQHGSARRGPGRDTRPQSRHPPTRACALARPSQSPPCRIPPSSSLISFLPAHPPPPSIAPSRPSRRSLAPFLAPSLPRSLPHCPSVRPSLPSSSCPPSFFRPVPSLSSPRPLSFLPNLPCPLRAAVLRRWVWWCAWCVCVCSGAGAGGGPASAAGARAGPQRPRQGAPPPHPLLPPPVVKVVFRLGGDTGPSPAGPADRSRDPRVGGPVLMKGGLPGGVGGARPCHGWRGVPWRVTSDKCSRVRVCAASSWHVPGIPLTSPSHLSMSPPPFLPRLAGGAAGAGGAARGVAPGGPRHPGQGGAPPRPQAAHPPRTP